MSPAALLWSGGGAKAGLGVAAGGAVGDGVAAGEALGAGEALAAMRRRRRRLGDGGLTGKKSERDKGGDELHRER